MVHRGSSRHRVSVGGPRRMAARLLVVVTRRRAAGQLPASTECTTGQLPASAAWTASRTAGQAPCVGGAHSASGQLAALGLPSACRGARQRGCLRQGHDGARQGSSRHRRRTRTHRGSSRPRIFRRAGRRAHGEAARGSAHVEAWGQLRWLSGTRWARQGRPPAALPTSPASAPAFFLISL